jgi:hypothetical protein
MTNGSGVEEEQQDYGIREHFEVEHMTEFGNVHYFCMMAASAVNCLALDLRIDCLQRSHSLTQRAKSKVTVSEAAPCDLAKKAVLSG